MIKFTLNEVLGEHFGSDADKLSDQLTWFDDEFPAGSGDFIMHAVKNNNILTLWRGDDCIGRWNFAADMNIWYEDGLHCNEYPSDIQDEFYDGIQTDCVNAIELAIRANKKNDQ